ncbi:MAG: zinc ABC transporter substrate-binding protein [Arcobacteraceae bacterium]|nr:zinc ABC transporter substrate-binding protein [Arcobacteraceae bacterium]
MLKKIFTIGFFTYCIFISQLFAKDTLIVSIPPQKYFIEQIAKDNFNIKSMMDDDSILPTYKPTAQQYVWTENAIAYFKIGMYDEKKWIKKIKIKNKTIQTFDTNLNTQKYLISNDINTWLDPVIVKIQAKNILNSLTHLDPKNKKFYRDNYFKFMNNISRLDYQLKVLFKKNIRNHFIVFMPSWSYFSKRYNLKQLEINADPFSADKENIIEILNQINKYTSNIVFIPKYYFPKVLFNKVDEKYDTVVVPISPLEYDWADNLLNIAKIIAYQQK